MSTASPGTGALERYLDERLGGPVPITLEPIQGGGSCEVFALDRGGCRWVLRRAPRHASSATAHDVLREFRILDAIKDEAVRIARPVLSCNDVDVFQAPFYVMERIPGSPIRSTVPAGWAAAPETHGVALEELIDALVAVHAVDWGACGLGDLARSGDYLPQQLTRWIAQLDGYGGRDLSGARRIASWLGEHLPVPQLSALCHGDYKLDNLLFAADPPPRLLAVVDWEMAAIGDPLVDLAWALIFHPGPEGTMPLGRARDPRFVLDHVPDRDTLVDRYVRGSGRDASAIGWYDVFARWKLAVVLEGSYVKHQRGQSDNPLHEYFGLQVDRLLDSATTIVEHEGAL
ncbi:MAG: phosphotransferase family protein [Acidimicrobiales bacterium]